MSIITLTNNSDPERDIRFRISAPGVFYLAKNLFIYDPVKKVVIAEINKMKSVKDIDKIQFGHEQHSISFIKDIPQFDVKRRRRTNFDGDFFYIPLGYKENYNRKHRRGANMFTRHKINTCSLYIPINVFKKFKLVNKGEKINNFTKEIFRRFRLEVSDSQTDENFVITGKCNNTVVDLNKNKDLVDDLKNIVKDAYKYHSDFKLTQEWKQGLMVNLENFVNKYEDYEVQH